jgi:hypothetical protein
MFPLSLLAISDRPCSLKGMRGVQCWNLCREWVPRTSTFTRLGRSERRRVPPIRGTQLRLLDLRKTFREASSVKVKKAFCGRGLYY